MLVGSIKEEQMPKDDFVVRPVSGKGLGQQPVQMQLPGPVLWGGYFSHALWDLAWWPFNMS
jgi:hypothetical protein